MLILKLNFGVQPSNLLRPSQGVRDMKRRKHRLVSTRGNEGSGRGQDSRRTLDIKREGARRGKKPPEGDRKRTATGISHSVAGRLRFPEVRWHPADQKRSAGKTKKG